MCRVRRRRLRSRGRPGTGRCRCRTACRRRNARTSGRPPSGRSPHHRCTARRHAVSRIVRSRVGGRGLGRIRVRGRVLRTGGTLPWMLAAFRPKVAGPTTGAAVGRTAAALRSMAAALRSTGVAVRSTGVALRSTGVVARAVSVGRTPCGWMGGFRTPGTRRVSRVRTTASLPTRGFRTGGPTIPGRPERVPARTPSRWIAVPTSARGRILTTRVSGRRSVPAPRRRPGPVTPTSRIGSGRRRSPRRGPPRNHLSQPGRARSRWAPRGPGPTGPPTTRPTASGRTRRRRISRLGRSATRRRPTRGRPRPPRWRLTRRPGRFRRTRHGRRRSIPGPPRR